MSSGLLTINAAVRSETAARERVERRIAVLLERQRHHLESGRRRCGRVARVRLDRRDDLVALAELAARARGRRASRRRGCTTASRAAARPGRRTGPCPTARGGSRRARGSIASTPCSVSSSWCGWSSASSGRAAISLVEARVVLHRAGAEQADPHHPERLLGEVQVVALAPRTRTAREAPEALARRIAAGTEPRPVADGARIVGSGSGKTQPAAARRGPAPSRAARPRRPRGSGVSARLLMLASPPQTASTSRSMSSLGVHLGHAVERALPELGEDRREVLAAEDAVAPQRRR